MNVEQRPVILISGASSGIGEATARLSARQGYRVVLAARRMERLEAIANEIERQGGEALPVKVDLTHLDEVRALVNTAVSHFGEVDILVNNAGFGRLKFLDQLDPERDILPQLMVNLVAAIQLTHLVLPGMIEKHSGHIINIGSVAGLIALPSYSVYAASKFGLKGFTDALRREVALWGIDVTGIYPGSVVTEFEQHAGIERKTGLRTPNWLRLSDYQVAEKIIQVIKKPRRQVIMPGYLSYAVWINQAFPGLVDWLLQIGYVQRERGK